MKYKEIKKYNINKFQLTKGQTSERKKEKKKLN